jgi:hypothetical protein
MKCSSKVIGFELIYWPLQTFLQNHFSIQFFNSNFIQVPVLKSTVCYTGDDISSMISVTHPAGQFSF